MAAITKIAGLERDVFFKTGMDGVGGPSL
jgi:hypothetical protein